MSELSIEERAVLSRVLVHMEGESPIAPDLPAIPLAPPRERRTSAVTIAAGVFLLAVAVVVPAAWLSHGSTGVEIPPGGVRGDTVAEQDLAPELTTTTIVAPAITGGVLPDMAVPDIDPMILSLLPWYFDAYNAIPVYSTDGNAMDVADAYLASRFPDLRSVGVEIAYLEEADGFVLARWAWGLELDPEAKETEHGRGGWLILRPNGDGYEVIAATTNGVDMSGVGYGGELGGVAGTVTGPSGLSVDVLTLDGLPVPSAPYPNGIFPEGAYVYGTAGVSNSSSLEFAVSPIPDPVIVRAHIVGGTLLSVSEFVFQLSNPATKTGAPNLTPLMPRVVIDILGFEIVDGSESRDGSDFRGEWFIRIGDVSGRIVLDSDTSTPSTTFDGYKDVRAVTVPEGQGLLGVNDEGLAIEWDMDDRITVEIEGNTLNADAVAEAIRYVDEATWRRLLPEG